MNNFGFLFKRRKNKHSDKSTNKELVTGEEKSKLSDDINKTEKALKTAFGQSLDFTLEHINVGQQDGMICYLDTMISKQNLTNLIYRPLEEVNKKGVTVTEESFDEFRKKYFSGLTFTYSEYLHEVVWQLLSGFVVIIVNGVSTSITFELNVDEKRGVEEPSTQTIIRGPKDGFNESILTNISLIRRRIKNQHLQFEKYIIGKDTQTTVAIGYINGITNKDILDEVKERINKIEASAILDSGNIEEFIIDKSFTPFPLTFSAERPDSIASQLVEGKVAILVDGSPFVIAVPSVFTDFFQATEDYYQPFFMATFVRIIRYMSFMIALVLPSLYVAITTFHHELLPTDLLISVQAQREGVPFPAVVEIFMMELTFEVLREAGIRMPRAVGPTVSIVGALVLGQAAVEAGLVSNVLVIIVAFTAIASFVSPIYNFSIATRLLRFLLIITAAFFGLYGILLSLVIMVTHLTSLRSFGVPYLAPVAPLKLEDQTDVFFRSPIWANKKRPTYLKPDAPVKKENTDNPSPPMGKKGDQS